MRKGGVLECARAALASRSTGTHCAIFTILLSRFPARSLDDAVGS